jgi:hypothetical protein
MPDTDGLRIKDAELFEVSVVSVPCNQSATFSLAKSFDSMEEYKEFVKSFKQENSVDLAGQSLATEESNLSDLASETPELASKDVSQEIKMEKELDLQALAQKVAQETAAQIAKQYAEEKAAEKAAAQEAAEKAAAQEAAKNLQQD